VLTGVWPLYEVEKGVLRLIGKTATSRRAPQAGFRCAITSTGRAGSRHFTEDDIAYFQSKVDEMWNHWLVPGVIPFATTPRRTGRRHRRPVPQMGSSHGADVRARPGDRRQPALQTAGCSCFSASSAWWRWRTFSTADAFVPPLQKALHAEQAAVAGHVHRVVLLETWLVPFEGWLVDKFRSTPLVIAGGILAGIGWVGAGNRRR